METISFYSSKGGVGKTASSAMLAYELAKRGYNVLAIDLCQNGNLANNFGETPSNFYGETIFEWLTETKNFTEVAKPVKGYDNLYFIASNNSLNKLEKYLDDKNILIKDLLLRDKLDGVKDVFDFVLLDTHPNPDELPTKLGIFASDLVVIPTGTDGNEIQGALRSAKMIEAARPQLERMGIKTDYAIVETRTDASFFKKKKKNDQFQENDVHNVYRKGIRKTKVFEDLTKIDGEERQSYDELLRNKYFKNLVSDYSSFCDYILEKLNDVEVVK